MNGLPENRDHPDKVVFLQHRHEQNRPGAAEFDKFHDRRETSYIGRLLPDIDDMNELPGRDNPPERVDRRRVDDRIA